MHRRNYATRQLMVDQDFMPVDADDFVVTPLCGQIWPNSEAEISVTFNPRRSGEHCEAVYCDISGKEQRLPLTLKGVGQGPQVKCTFDKFDMGNVFVKSRHVLDVVLENVGCIDAPFHITQDHESLFGSQFQLSQTEGVIAPDG